MSRAYSCDECGETVDGDPIELAYWVEDDGDDIWNDWHLCSWSCVAAFGMVQAVEHMGEG